MVTDTKIPRHRVECPYCFGSGIYETDGMFSSDAWTCPLCLGSGYPTRYIVSRYYAPQDDTVSDKRWALVGHTHRSYATYY